MDTKLKKFNGSFILKLVAFLLCLSCVMNCTTQTMTSLYKASDSNITDRAYVDAFYELIMIDREIAETETFKYHVRNFAETVTYMNGVYGDGSEKAYNSWKKSLDEWNEELFKNAQKNLAKHVITDEFLLCLKLVEDGTVTLLGRLEEGEYSGSRIDYYPEDVEDRYVDYGALCLSGASDVVEFTNDENLNKKAKELGAEGIFELNNYYRIVDVYAEDPEDEDEVVELYKPGYYAFKINDEVLDQYLDGVYREDRYDSAEDFAEEHKGYVNKIKEKYPSGKYFIRDADGTIYTNVKGLNSKSTQEDIENKFSSFGFYLKGDRYGDLRLPDGLWHSSVNYGYYLDYRESSYGYDEYDYGVMTTMHYDAEDVTLAPTTTVKQGVNVDMTDTTPFMNESDDDFVCFIGVDMYPDNYPDTDRFKTSRFQIETAKEILSDALMTLGIMGSLFLVCFIYLVVRAGRRKGSTEVHLNKADRMFNEIRIALDGLIGFGVVLLMFSAIDEFAHDDSRDVLTRLLSILAALFAVIVLDLVLFITKQLKAKTIFKNTFIGWLVVKCLGAVVRKIKIASSIYKEKIKPCIKDRFLYTKEFSKGTLIRVGIVVGANLILAFFGTVETADNGTFFLYTLLFMFDVAVIVWVVRFIGGVNKIFSALEEIRQGNYNVYINTYALPSTLRESAGKVMSLRDGLKTAVEEAVKQEQTKTELITNVSHDLKTPLTSIINYVELLKKCNITDDDAKEYLEILGEKSDRLKKLIEDLVEASKASTGNIKVDFVRVSLNEMVSQLLGEHADGLEKKKLNVITEFSVKDIAVNADGKLLYRVMENLIVNVEKYSLYGTRVYVTVDEENGYGTVTFKNISEQPLNITADQLKERFVRGDESRSTEGNGLGLSIAQSLCDVQGGELEISINGDLFTAKVKLKK